MTCTLPMLHELDECGCTAPTTNTRGDRARRHNAKAIERALARRDFRSFVEGAWPTVEPTRALLPSVAIDAMCAAGQAVGEGRIKRLACSTCPGTSKSLLWAVMFPAWLLLRSGGSARIMSGSYAWDLASRDSRRCRDLITSAWYRGLVGDAWSIRDDADRRDDWWTTTAGRRLVTSTGAKTLGERATFQILDDVLSGADVHSAAARAEATRWVNEVLPSRLEDPERDARVMVGQRLHVADPIAIAIEQGWRYLFLPAVLAEGDERCVLLDDLGNEVWRDDRRVGEPLVSLLGPEAQARLKIELGTSAWASQYLQRPHDDSASMFPRSCFTRRWTAMPERIDRQVIALDASFKAGASSDFAVIQCWASSGADRYLAEQWRKQAGFADTLAALKEMAKRHPFAKILIESAANGHAIYDQISRELPQVHEVKTNGDSKRSRAASVQAIVERGVVVLPATAPWVDDWIDEVAGFPDGARHDDVVDAMVYALRELQGSVDPDLEALRLTHRRNLGALLSDQYRGEELALRIEHRMAVFDARHRKEEPPTWERFYAQRSEDTTPRPSARAPQHRSAPIGENVLPGNWRTR